MIEIRPVENINAVVSIPGSKSITQRALITAALAGGTSTLQGPLVSEDTDYSSAALGQMGVLIEKGARSWRVVGTGGRIAEPDDDIWAITELRPVFLPLLPPLAPANLSLMAMSACASGLLNR